MSAKPTTRSEIGARSEIAAKKQLPRDGALAEQIVRAIHAATADPRKRGVRGCVQWTIAVKIRKALGASEAEFNRAVAFGVSGEWLMVNSGHGTHSICIAREGWELVK